MMTRRDIETSRKSWWAALACAALVLFAAAPAFAQEETEASEVTAAASTKMCEGKYKTRDGETIISVTCPNLVSSCTCTATGIDCGGTTKAAPTGGTFVEGSCKTTYVNAMAIESEVLEALYRAIFNPE